MQNILLAFEIGVVLILGIILFYINRLSKLYTKSMLDNTKLEKNVLNLQNNFDFLMKNQQSYFKQSRDDFNLNSKNLREEIQNISNNLKGQNLDNISFQKNEFADFKKDLTVFFEKMFSQEMTNSKELNEKWDKLTDSIKIEMKEINDSLLEKNDLFRKDISEKITILGKNTEDILKNSGINQNEKLDGFGKNLSNDIDALNKSNFKFNEQFKKSIEDKITAFSELSSKILQDSSENQKEKLESINKEMKSLTEINAKKIEELKTVLDNQLSKLREENRLELDKMRKTVDEQLQDSLQKKLNESFSLVLKQLEQVYNGLGEMKKMASEVGGLKKILENVKTRGNLGELLLENILEEILSPQQFIKNAQCKKNSKERVEFAVVLPGKDDDNKNVLLPIDSKFPKENYQRLLDAYEIGNTDEIKNQQSKLKATIKSFAKDIRDKYINPPNTTDFAIMFLPAEGLYSEVLRHTGLFESLQKDYHVNITGPTTFAALLNSLQMGFRTLAVQKRSTEVWKLLAAIKVNFGKFNEILEKTRAKINDAGSFIDKATDRTRMINNKLNKITDLPESETKNILPEILDNKKEV